MAFLPALAGLNQAANARILQNSGSDRNMANYRGVFDIPEGGTMSAMEQDSADLNAEEAMSAMGASPAIRALRDAADESRMQEATNLEAEASDFAAHGQERGLQRAKTQNLLQDTSSEGAARRQTLPWAAQAESRASESANSLADARYGAPARTKAYGDVEAARMNAQGRVGAVEARTKSLPQEALFGALKAFIEATGKMPSPEDVAQLQKFYLQGGGQ